MSIRTRSFVAVVIAATCFALMLLWKIERLPFACRIDEERHEIGGGVILASINTDCSYNNHRSIVFTYDQPGDLISTTMHKTVQSKDESPTGLGYLEDLDGDSMPEGFVVGDCDAKGGCQTTVYSINSAMKMERLFTIHSFELIMKGNILIASNRDSCCEWRYDYYQGPLRNISQKLDDSYISSTLAPNGNESPLRASKAEILNYREPQK